MKVANVGNVSLKRGDVIFGIDSGATNTRGTAFEVTLDQRVLKPLFSHDVGTNSKLTWGEVICSVIGDGCSANNLPIRKVKGVSCGIAATSETDAAARVIGARVNNKSGEIVRFDEVDKSLSTEFGVNATGYLNDMEAIAVAIASGSFENQISVLRKPVPGLENPQTVIVFGDGTGRGVGIAIRNDDGTYSPLHSEGSHLNGPGIIFNDREVTAKFLQFLDLKNKKKAEGGWRPDYEDVVNHGIRDAYEFVTDSNENIPSIYDIQQGAINGNENCLKAMTIYVESLADNIRQMSHAVVTNKVSLTGQIWNVRDLITPGGRLHDVFINALTNNAKYEDQLMNRINVDVVEPEGLGQRGAAEWLLGRINNNQLSKTGNNGFLWWRKCLRSLANL